IQTLKTVFYEIIPFSWIAYMNKKELKFLLRGVQSYDIEDWEKNKSYWVGYSVSIPKCIWFWKFVQKSNDETKAQIMKF
ncbi:hypothetical protein MXB_4198, partial [Myxobolus squamalis]